ncbi:MAG: hypothetical protein K8U57_28500 [Planctomycetes bacterium]|nr:hypothetical protein [Planctomycetota bacterium]
MAADFLKEHLLAIKPEVESDSELPDLAAPYQAHGRASNKSVSTLHCALGKDGYRSFQYMHLDSDSSFRMEATGHVIVVRFVGWKPIQVTIRGRNLWQLYDYIHQHRVPWVMRAERDFVEGKQTVITAIEIREVRGDAGV